MANEVSIYEPRHLIEVVRTTPPIRTFLRDRFFSNVKTFPTRRVDIDIVKGNRKMAAFIHPLVGGEIVQSEGYETKSYAPPLINPATISTADQYMERLPGEDLFSGRTPADRAASGGGRPAGAAPEGEILQGIGGSPSPSALTRCHLSRRARPWQ